MHSVNDLQNASQIWGAVSFTVHPTKLKTYLQVADLTELEATLTHKNIEGLREAINRSLFHINTVTLSYSGVGRTYSLWYPPIDINTVDLRDCYRVDSTLFHIKGEEVGWMDASLILTGGIYHEIKEALSREQLDITKVKFKRYGRTQFKNSYEVYVYGDDPTEIHGIKALQEMFPHMSRKKLKEMNFPTLDDRKEEVIYDLGLQSLRNSRGELYLTAEGGRKFLKNPNQLMKYINEETQRDFSYPKARKVWNDVIRRS